MRLSYFKNTSSSAEVLEENNYYPFGLKHEGYNPTPRNHAYKYQFGGKELQTETGWNDFGARMYMPDMARWGAMDPLAEAEQSWTPFRYGFNNPIMFTDPTGMIERSDIDRMMSTGGSYNYSNGNLNYLGGGQLGGNYLTDDRFRQGYYTPVADWIDIDIPEVTIKSKGNKYTWNSEANYGSNSYLMMSKITGALGNWNYNVNSSNMGQYILNSKASMEVAEFEKFLFLELPASFAGGEFISAGWRAAGVGKLISSKFLPWMGRSIFGADAATTINASRLINEEGVHQILLHGTPDGFYIDGTFTTAKELARGLLNNGFQKGTPIRLISCNTGIFGDGAAYQLSRYLKSPVTAPTNLVRVLEDGSYQVFGGGRFRTFFNTTIK